MLFDMYSLYWLSSKGGTYQFLQFKVVLFSFLFKSHSSLYTDILFDLPHKHKSIKSYETSSLLSNIHI